MATVSASGLMEGIGAGEAEIVATSGEVSASYRVQVRLQPAASIKLTVPDGPVTIGDSFRVVARVFDAKGALLTGRSVALMLGALGAMSLVARRRKTAVATPA